MIRRVEVEKIVPKLSKQGFKILLDILATTRSRLRVREISAEFRERLHGESKLDTMIALEFLGLLVSKLTNDLVSVRFFLFCLVGSIGLILHLIVLRMVILLEFASFGIAQLIATFVAMSSNYILNNVLTYRDSRLKGGKFVRGLLGFYLVCSLGVFANVGVANFVYTFGSIWWLAGTIGVLIGAFWNYAASNFLVWRR